MLDIASLHVPLAIRLPYWKGCWSFLFFCWSFYFRGWLNHEFSHLFLPTLMELLLYMHVCTPHVRRSHVSGLSCVGSLFDIEDDDD
jgi:hypothetical protein